MAIITKTKEEIQTPLTKEQIAEVIANANREIVYDEDCPKLSERLLEKARAYRREHPIKNAG